MLMTAQSSNASGNELPAVAVALRSPAFATMERCEDICHDDELGRPHPRDDRGDPGLLLMFMRRGWMRKAS
jgi:hypothetical protein